MQCHGLKEFSLSACKTDFSLLLQISINDAFSLSTNVDAPEGGLEALLQVAVCTNVSIVVLVVAVVEMLSLYQVN